MAPLPALAVFTWATLVVVGFGVLTRYSNTPSQAVIPPVDSTNYSTGMDKSAANERWTLVMAVHPKCPCTLASVSELERLIPHIGKETNIHVLVYRPENENANWSDTVMVGRLLGTSQVTLVDDPDGQRAQQLGITASGGVVLTDPQGRLSFAGGITAARGHEGPNDGVSAICNWVLGQPDPLCRTSVYGCSLAATGSQK